MVSGLSVIICQVSCVTLALKLKKVGASQSDKCTDRQTDTTKQIAV
jgi:hypothetical protein